MQTVKEDIQQFRILYVEKDDRRVQSFQQNFQDQADITSVPDGQTALDYLAVQSLVDLIVYNDALDSTTWFLNKLGSKRTATSPPVVLLTDHPGLDLTTDKFYGRVIDAFPQNYSQFDLRIRLNYLIQKKAYEQSEHTTDDATMIRMPLGKRLFDIGFALLLLTAASPILLIAAILIKLDSKGPIFYSSKRVGTGFKIFDMYKFRTMRTGADKMLAGMASLNMYNAAPANRSDSDLCDTCRMGGTACQRPLFMDQKQICEVLHQQEQKEKAMFSKFKEDPRVTRLGKILRNTSIDELPQLFNILRGDMSFVGNRPLPVYEAEKLTTIGYNRRFAAPAGLTGLWQVMKRGKSKVSDQERIHLDVLYAKTYSFRTDMLILLKTVKAVWQKENV